MRAREWLKQPFTPKPESRGDVLAKVSTILLMGVFVAVLVENMAVYREARAEDWGQIVGYAQARDDAPETWGLYRCTNETGAVMWSLQQKMPPLGGDSFPYHPEETTLFLIPGSPWACAFVAEGRVWP